MMEVSINAWTGESDRPPHSPIRDDAIRWLLKQAGRPDETKLRPPALPDWNDWTDKRIGWGLIVPKTAGVSDADLAACKDLKDDQALQALLEDRRTRQGAVPVFRYDAGTGAGHGQVFLRNYAARRDLDLASGIGLADDRLPFYLLIYADPVDIPWSFQYLLNARHAVGRLTPNMPGVERYVAQLAKGWDGAAASAQHTVTWAVDHGPNDITRLMRNSVALKLHERFAADPDIGANAVFLDGTTAAADGRGSALIETLESTNPAMVVTSSHGRTGPLNDHAALAATLGIPIDQQYRDLDLDALFQRWQPDGAVWLAQACCSAGSANPSGYDGLFEPGSEIGAVLSGVAAAGSHIAPLPQRLLGAEKPARAFFGQVEPTFNITLQQQETRQILTDPMIHAFYNRLFQPLRLGRVLTDYHKSASTRYRQWKVLRNLFDQGEDVTNRLLFVHATATDIDSLVLIGDPTAILP